MSSDIRTDKIFHVISNTHWDREWRFPFQRNRQMLVDTIDSVLDILEKEPEYRAFHLDSQSIVLRDYLEIRPHKTELLVKLVKENRLLIGPWYILPEEFQVGGENLIRNLLLGHRICREYGGVSKIGYSPFSWGQISQLPQLYREFGINLIMFYRGVNSLDSHNAEFMWEGTDGTKALSTRFSTMPRYNFYFLIYRPVLFNQTPYDIAYKWNEGGIPFHFADERMNDEDFFMIEYKQTYFKENIKGSVEKIVGMQADDFTTPHVIWMEGHDSSGPNIDTVKILKDIREEFPGIQLKHSTLEEYAAALEKDAKKDELPLVTGERRSAQYDLRSGNLYGYTTSARMYLKQKNFEAENLLQFYAEPFYNFAGLLGLDTRTNYIDIAWNYLVQNSAHDSIGGCSLDEIHDDMMWRYRQVIEIAKGVFERAGKHILKNINMPEKGFDGKSEFPVYVTAINPTTYQRSEYITAFVDVPLEMDKGRIKLIDPSGKEVPSIILESYAHQPVLEQMINRPMYFDMQRYKVMFLAANVPAVGYKVFQVKPVNKIRENNDKIAFKKDDKINLENEFLKVVINKNGTFNLKNKRNGKVYNKLGHFYDEGDSGHAWVLTPTAPFIDTLKALPKIKIVENDALHAVVKISHEIIIPENLAERLQKRPKLIRIKIRLYLTLRKDSKRVDIRVEVNNKAEAHRLRILFPTKLKASHHFGEGQFDVVQRPVERINAEGWVEKPMHDYPMHHFAAVEDGENGLAVIVKGLKEYEVTDDDDRTIAITLFRTFNYIIYPSSKEDYSFQKGAQMLGKSEYEMSVYPYSGEWSADNVYREALEYNLPLSVIQSGRTHGELPVSKSFISVEDSNLIFSAFKKAEQFTAEQYALRVYNPTTSVISSKINFGMEAERIFRSNLEETLKEEINPGYSIDIEIPAKKIFTYLISFK